MRRPNSTPATQRGLVAMLSTLPSDGITDARICVSRDIMELRRAREHTPANKLVYIPNAVDPEQFGRPARGREAVMREFGWPAGDPLVLSVGLAACGPAMSGLPQASDINQIMTDAIKMTQDKNIMGMLPSMGAGTEGATGSSLPLPDQQQLQQMQTQLASTPGAGSRIADAMAYALPYLKEFVRRGQSAA